MKKPPTTVEQEILEADASEAFLMFARGVKPAEVAEYFGRDVLWARRMRRAWRYRQREAAFYASGGRISDIKALEAALTKIMHYTEGARSKKVLYIHGIAAGALFPMRGATEAPLPEEPPE